MSIKSSQYLPMTIHFILNVSGLGSIAHAHFYRTAMILRCNIGSCLKCQNGQTKNILSSKRKYTFILFIAPE